MDATTEATDREVPLEHLEHEICQLSAHLSAAMCRWLVLVAEFDRREGWAHQGAKSCALAGIDPGGGGKIDDGPAPVLCRQEAGSGTGFCRRKRSPCVPSPWLSSEAAHRLACDSGVVAMSLGAGGEPLSVGRSTPTIPRHIRRALRTRDGGCRFPGCGQRRFVDGHHIVHWAHGGETSLVNLCLLCRFHHHAVHEGGFGLERTTEGTLVFTTPAGGELATAPEAEPVDLDVEDVNRRLGVVIGSGTGASLWGGERLDLGLTLDALLCLEGRLGA